MPRSIRTRATSTIALAPATVTDRTCALVLGLEPRVYRELVRDESIPHATIGRRIVCRVADVLDALDRISGAVEAERRVEELGRTDVGTGLAANEVLEPDQIRSMAGAQRENRVLRMLGRERGT